MLRWVLSAASVAAVADDLSPYPDGAFGAAGPRGSQRRSALTRPTGPELPLRRLRRSAGEEAAGCVEDDGPYGRSCVLSIGAPRLRVQSEPLPLARTPAERPG